MCCKNFIIPSHCEPIKRERVRRVSKRITLVANICFEPYFRSYLKDRFAYLSSDIQVNVVIYEDYQSELESIRVADVIIVCLNFEEFYPNLTNDILLGKTTYAIVVQDCIRKCSDLYSYLKLNSKAPIVWFGFEDYYCLQNRNYGSLLVFNGLVDQLNRTLDDMLKEDAFIDFKRLIAAVGIYNAYDIKGKYRWNAPYSKELILLMVNEVYKQYLISTGSTKKCLVLDCDNVLWGGILSEDGIEGIQIGTSGLGRPFQDFQRYLLNLYYHGVILAVCSKNDESDVLRVFREHTGMILREEHISCFKCNWDNKSDNIRDISEGLNIGLDSIVFVDDSVFEIESVKSMLPEITTILYHRDTIYDELYCFNLKCNIDLQTVRERTSTYKTNILRSELKKAALSYEDYIASLEMVVDIHTTTEDELVRVSELTQRTNKCTNGMRYTLDQIKYINYSEDYWLFTVCLSDKFCDLGIVGVIGLKGECVDLFSLSCRALGRKIEDKMIRWLLDKKIKNIHFVSTSKNEQLYALLEANEFAILR